LIDHDDHAAADIIDFKNNGIAVLGRRQIESYLWDDEVLAALCEKQGKATEIPHVIHDKRLAITASQARGNPSNDMKSATGELYNAVRRRLDITDGGNGPLSFARNTLAPLIKPGMKIYSELEEAIFC